MDESTFKKILLNPKLSLLEACTQWGLDNMPSCTSADMCSLLEETEPFKTL